jgi:hypothetical protein
VSAQITHAFSDGGVLLRNPSPIGGTWAIRLVSAAGECVASAAGIILTRQEILSCPSSYEPFVHDVDEVENNSTEAHAIAEALSRLPDGWSGTFCSDSENALGWAFGNVPLRSVMRATRDLYLRHRRRLGSIKPVLLAGHPSEREIQAGYKINQRSGRSYPVSVHNRECDRACSALADTYCKLTGQTFGRLPPYIPKRQRQTDQLALPIT